MRREEWEDRMRREERREDRRGEEKIISVE